MPDAVSLIDTHTHIYYADDDQALNGLIQRCLDNHVYQLLMPNVDSESISKVLHTATHYPEQCYPMMGLHPCSVKADFKQELETIRKVVDTQNIYGIGEIGLDLHWDSSTLSFQEEAFKIQVEWAKELGLPVSIHCRKAYNELFALLEQLQDGRLQGVLHCFTGDTEQAKKTIDYGLKLGIGGVVTFKNAGLDKVVQQLDLQHIVLETDSPYLAPVPFRGKENESSYLLYIAEKIADLQGIPLQTVADITSANAKQLFKL